MSTQQGYIASFLSEVPEDLTCVICSLVLRNPIQVIDCGHRFCSSCFNNMLEYSKDQLLCPIDRQPVERDRVFTDKGVIRMINNLKVKCKNDKEGCEWRGDLGDLDTHETSCQYEVVAAQTDQFSALNDLCKELLQRVQGCEEKSDMKEKELAHLRFTIKDLKENFNRDEKLKTLKEDIAYLKGTVKDMRDEAYRSKEHIMTLTNSSSELEKKVEMLKKEKEEIAQKCTNELKQLKEKNDYLEKQIKDIKSSTEVRNTNVNQQISLLNEKFSDNEKGQGKMVGDIRNLKTQLDNTQKEIRSTRSYLDKCLNKSKNEMIGKTIEMKNLKEHVGDLQNHVECVENILFCFDSVEKNKVELKWIMENFKEKRRIGQPVISPVFYTNVAGYCFELHITWSGAQHEKMGVALKLHRAKTEHGTNLELQPFCHDFTFEVLDRSGGSVKEKIWQSMQPKFNRENCFIIPHGQDQANLALESDEMIQSPFDDYVINDSIYLKCTLHL